MGKFVESSEYISRISMREVSLGVKKSFPEEMVFEQRSEM